MPRRARRPASPLAERILVPEEASLLDVLDHVLAKGVMASGDVTLGVAGVDLVYLRLSSILCAADRVLPADHGKVRRHRGPSPSRRLRRR